MSASEGSRKLLELLTCPICLERFRHPRTLPCLHSFCTECLDRCRRPHRHSLDCPICKRSVPLTSMGVRGLQVDYRIQQMEDIFNDHNKSPEPQPSTPEHASITVKCQLCEALKRRPMPDACKRCSFCNMVFCIECASKHDANPVFSMHRLHSLSDQVDACSAHIGCPIKYYCKQCQLLMCTACVLDHNEEHEQEPWDRSVVERYKEELAEVYQQVSIKVRELKSRTKHLETLRQTHQGSLYLVQNLIKSRASEMIQKIRERECQLLDESQIRFDGFLRELGVDTIGDLNFRQNQIEALCIELEILLNDSSLCKCLLSYDAIMTKYRNLILEPHGNSNASSSGNLKTRQLVTKKSIKFVPSCMDDVNFLIGSLQEFSVMSSTDDESLGQRNLAVDSSCSSLARGDGEAPSSSSSFDRLSLDSDLNYRPHRKRTKMILDAVCRGISPRHELGKLFRRMKSPSRTDNRSHSNIAGSVAADHSQDVPGASNAPSNAPPNAHNGDVELSNDGNTNNSRKNKVSFTGLRTNHRSIISDIIHLPSTVSNLAQGYLPLASVAQASMDVHKCLEALSTSRQAEDVQSSSNPASSGSLTEIVSAERCIRHYMQIEKIGSLLGNLLPSKSICFVKGSDTSTFAGGLFADLSLPSRPPSDWLLVVAETGHRLHVFDSRGSSSRLIGWGNIKPQVVAYSEEGLVYCTDKRDMTVKTFHLGESWLSTSWQVGMFDHPHGLAITSRGHLVVTDIVRNSVTVHCSITGQILQRLSHPAEVFARPAYVAVDKSDNVYVSDICKKCIFVFNTGGCFVRTITLPQDPTDGASNLPSSSNSSSSSSSSSLTNTSLHPLDASPHGLAIDPNGNLAICDWRNNRIVRCSPDGSNFSVYTQCYDLFHPTNISFDRTGKFFAIVESLDLADNECGRVRVYEVI